MSINSTSNTMTVFTVYWDYYFRTAEEIFLKVCSAEVF